MTPEKTLGHRLFEYGYAERVDGRAVLNIATYYSGKGWEFEPIDLGPLPEGLAQIRCPQRPLPEAGKSYMLSLVPTQEEAAWSVAREEAGALADALVHAVKTAQEIGTRRYVVLGGRRQGRTFLEFVWLMLQLGHDPSAIIKASSAAWDMLARWRPDLVAKPAPGIRCPRCHRTDPPPRCAVCNPEVPNDHRRSRV